MPAVFHRLDNSLIEILPTYPDSIQMSGRYVIDFPDNFDLKPTGSIAPNQAAIITSINEMFKEKFVSFDYFVTNNLLSNLNFTDNFETDTSLSISVVDNQFFPVGANNQEYSFINSYKSGDLPNTLAILGRWPQTNHLEDESITYDGTAAGNNCIITKDIPISTQTNDGLGRTDFFLYFRSALKSYVKDRSLSDKEKNVAPNIAKTANRTGVMAYTHTQYDSTNRLRCFISGDGGNTYQEIENLKVFSFSGKVDSIKLAWVNYTDADLNLLSYTLMY